MPIIGAACGPLRALSDIVNCYIRCCRPGAVKELSKFKPVSLSEAIKMAGTARDPEGKKFAHQWRIQNSVLEKFADRLERNRAEISASRTFEGLFDIICGIRKAKADLKGIGKLTIYDTALRIGTNLGLRPDHIYLHAGTTDGAKALDLYDGQDRLDPIGVPKVLNRLEPYEIEDLLCIYKDDLKKFYK